MRRRLLPDQACDAETRQRRIAHHIHAVGDEADGHGALCYDAVFLELPTMQSARRGVAIADASVPTQIVGMLRSAMIGEIAG